MKPFVPSKSNGFFDAFDWSPSRNSVTITRQFGNLISNGLSVPRKAGQSAKVSNAVNERRIMRGLVRGYRY